MDYHRDSKDLIELIQKADLYETEDQSRMKIIDLPEVIYAIEIISLKL